MINTSSKPKKFITLSSGIGNQLIPLISMIRVCQKLEHNLYIKFNKINSYNFTKVLNNTYTLLDLVCINFKYNSFDNIPKNCIIKNLNWSSKDCVIQSNEENNILFKNICHIITLNNDSIEGCHPTPRERIKINNILEELRNIAKLINPIDIINDKVQEVVRTFTHNVLGLHIRTLDGGFIELFNKKRLLLFIDNFIEKNLTWKIYISTDNINIEHELVNLYGNKIIKFDNPFGNNYNDKFSDNNYGLMNAICEIFILSKCNNFVGSAGSTFSFFSWLRSDNNILNFWNNEQNDSYSKYWKRLSKKGLSYKKEYYLMYHFVSACNKFDYIFMPKNYSESFRNCGLFQRENERLIKSYNNKLYENMKKIIILREPIQRFVSGFLWEYGRNLIEKKSTLIDTFMYYIEINLIGKTLIAEPQIRYLTAKNLKIEDIDIIMLDKTYNIDFDAFKNKYKLNIKKLDKNKSSPTDSKTLLSYIEENQEVKSTILRLYEEDVLMYNYACKLKGIQM